MLLVLRTMQYLGYETTTVEFIASAISTWSGKINMIVVSMAMGMTISLIPTIVSAYTLKNWLEVNKKINASLKMIIFISLPLAIGLSMLSKQVWSVFYGVSDIGSTILSVSVFVAVSLNIYMVTSSIIQGLNKFKTVYIASIAGFLSNAILDVPLMLLFNYFGLPSYLGALVSSIIGYLLSSFIALKAMQKDSQINYQETFKCLFKLLIPLISLILVLSLFKLIPYNINSKLSCILSIIINTLGGGFTYIFISWKLKLLDDIMGQELINKIIKKLTFKKVS
jgi:O-antigen/teichoic acid export membrane protein